MRAQRDVAFTHFRDVVHVLTVRHVKSRYRGSALGVFWSLLNPAIMAFVYSAVFGHQFAHYYGNSSLQYLLAVFIGLTVNGFFASSTAVALRSVVDSGGLINKVRTPLSVFPLSMILAAAVQLGAGGFPVIFAIGLAERSGVLGIALLIVPFISLTLLVFGVSYMLSAVYVFFRDVPYMYELVLFATWVAAPVFYPLEIVSERYQLWIRLNPLTQIMESIRDIVLRHTMPDWFSLAEPLGCALLLCVVGLAVFQMLSPRFMDYL